jgi:uncharacterized protein (DUF1015 family)
VSPVYSLYRPRDGEPARLRGETVVRAEADGQWHRVERVTDGASVREFARLIAASDVYIADGHHRYETALVYRDEVRARASGWTGDEPENFVLMALTPHDDPGLLVLPTHRLVRPRALPSDPLARLAARFDIEPLDSDVGELMSALQVAGERTAAFVAAGLDGGIDLLTLRDRAGVEAMMPADQPSAWKGLDVNVLQYGIIQDVFGVDDETLAAGSAVSYTQDAHEAIHAVRRGEARVAFLLNATPIDQVFAVADAGARMPQKSTYFQPKLPTGLVLRPLE